MKLANRDHTFRVLLLLAAAGHVTWAGSQVIFDTPDKAVNALLAALASDDYFRFLSVAGPGMAGFWSNGDPERDALERSSFLDSARRNGILADSISESQKVLNAGTIQQFPAPLVKTEAGWRFDDYAGSQELARRWIRRNETAAVEFCQRFREAQYEYRATAGESRKAFAMTIRSTPGRHDGLYWIGRDEEDESPLGPPFASAAYSERQSDQDTRPLFGYYFKVLWAQGQDSAGGALDYRSHGHLRKGFALVAWPSDYGVAGTETFLINHLGDIYQKDLGPDTARIAGSMAVFNPDRSWSRYRALD